MSGISRWSCLDPSIRVEVERVSTDPDTDIETTVEIKGEESQSDGVCILRYEVSKEDKEIRVKLLNRNAMTAKIRAVFVLESSEEEPVDSLGEETNGIVELENCVLTKNGGLERMYWLINVPPTRETIRIYDRHSKRLMELIFHNSD